MKTTVSMRSLATSGFLAGLVVIGACRGGDGSANAPVVGPDNALQIAFGARLTLTDSGVARARLVADSALVYEEGLRFDLRRVRLVFVDTVGDSIGSLSALRAMYDVRTSQLEATGQVSVTAANGRVLQTGHVNYDPLADLLRGDSSYTFTQTAPARQSSGQGFESSPSLAQVGRAKPPQ